MKKILGAGAGQKWTGSATLIASCAAVINAFVGRTDGAAAAHLRILHPHLHRLT